MIENVWLGQPGDYFCLATKDDDDVFRNHFFLRDELSQCAALIRKLRRDYDVYWSVNAYRTAQRRKHEAVRGYWLYADLDEVDPHKLKLEPTIALQTSPARYQAMWRCNQRVSDDLNKCLVYRVGADKDSWARNKVLRVPDTWNHKYSPAPAVRLLWRDGPVYRASDIARTIGFEGGACTGGRVRKKLRSPADLQSVMRRGSVRRYMYEVTENTDRSVWIYGLVMRLNELAVSRDDIVNALQTCPAFIAKYGHSEPKAIAEVDRILEKST